MTERCRIYLAGQPDADWHNSVYQALRRVAICYNYKAQDVDIASLVDLKILGIEMCDVLIANLNLADSEALVEIGIAIANGKEVIVFSDGQIVFCPMVAENSKSFGSVEDVISYMRRDCERYY